MTAPKDIVDQALEQGFQLDGLQIEPQTGEVSGPGGREKLDRKVMDVLVLMAQHAGHVVSREELLAKLWPNAVVTDDALTRCFYELRRQLSHAGGDERYRLLLETLPKRGYRLNGTVTPLRPQTSAASPQRPKRRILAMAIAIPAAIVLVVIAGQRLTRGPDESQTPPATAESNSVAVLPFLDMSEDGDQGYFSNGVTEEILNRLSQSDNLRVIARTSSFSFRDESLDVPQIAARLNVAYVLEGSVRKSGGRLRITAQLIDASSNSHVWSNTYDRGLGDLFAVQDEIASSVATALQVTLARGKPGGQMPKSVDAYERFLQGKFFYDRRAPGDIERAVKYYEDAISIDPNYARAWAALAGAYSLLAWDGQTPTKALQAKQGEAALKAVELDPNLGIAHARLAQYYFETLDYKKAKDHSRKAVALDPDDPMVLALTGGEASAREDIGEAIAMQHRIVAQDPLAAAQRTNLAVLLLADAQLDEAMAEFRRVLELNPDAGLDVHIEIVRIFVLQRRYDEALTAVARLPEGKYRDHGLALLYQAPGRLVEADVALKRLAAQPGDMMDSIRLAEVFAFRGMSEEAFASLQKKKDALERDKNLGLSWIWFFQHEMRVSPFLTPLHADPRWAPLMAEPA